jgi:hypothetical protein
MVKFRLICAGRNTGVRKPSELFDDVALKKWNKMRHVAPEGGRGTTTGQYDIGMSENERFQCRTLLLVSICFRRQWIK